MRPLTLSLTAALASLAVGSALLVAPVSPASADDPAPVDPAASLTDPLTDAADPGTPAEQAVAALETAQDVLSGDVPTVGRGSEADAGADTGSDTAEATSVTMALRDVVATRDDLPEAQQEEAARVLARPTSGAGAYDGYSVAEETPVCSTVVCIHYVATTRDAPPMADNDDDGVPDYVTFAVRTLTKVHQTYVDAGYRAPKPDGTRGGDNRTDVYLSDVGRRGFYGYCTTDETSGASDVWAYCVLDNDYSSSQFPFNTSRQNLQVTAAHEYFHAVQFAYDIYEDTWFMEGTATWAEDEVFDNVNDNRQYLRESPISDPNLPLDYQAGLLPYGTWIFFRWLTELRPGAQGDLPTLVRDMWRRADAAPGGMDQYSIKAVGNTLAARNVSLTKAWAFFSTANRSPGRSYEEGKAYPSAPLAGSQKVTRSTDARNRSFRLNHLASATYRYVPSTGLGNGRWKLNFRFDLSNAVRGAGAVVTVNKKGARPTSRFVGLNTKGDGRISAKFTKGTVKWVEVTVVNAGDHYRCDTGDAFSCTGTSKDDRRRQVVKAHAVRR